MDQSPNWEAYGPGEHAMDCTRMESAQRATEMVTAGMSIQEAAVFEREFQRHAGETRQLVRAFSALRDELRALQCERLDVSENIATLTRAYGSLLEDHDALTVRVKELERERAETHALPAIVGVTR